MIVSFFFFVLLLLASVLQFSNQDHNHLFIKWLSSYNVLSIVSGPGYQIGMRKSYLSYLSELELFSQIYLLYTSMNHYLKTWFFWNLWNNSQQESLSSLPNWIVILKSLYFKVNSYLSFFQIQYKCVIWHLNKTGVASWVIV